MEQREITADEQRWVNRLKRCLKDMPSGLSMTLDSSSYVNVFDRKYLAANMEDWEALYGEEMDSIGCKHFYPHSETL